MEPGDPAADYNRLVETDPTAAHQAQWLREAFRRRGITFAGEPMRTFLRPHFVRRGAWDRLRQDGRRILELAARAARHAFDGDVGRLLEFLGAPEREAAWVRVDPGPPDVVLSRLDAFLTPQGPRFIEVNSDAPAGFGYGDRMAEVFAELPMFQSFRRGRQVEYLPSAARLVEAVLGAWRARGGTGTPVVGIVDWSDVKTRPDQEILAAAFQAVGVTCVLGDPRDSGIGGRRLVVAGHVLDIVYRRAVLSELVAREAEVRPFLEAYRQGLAVFVNSFRCHLSEDKAFFGLLTDEAFAGSLLSPEEAAFVDRVVPWTRRVAQRRTTRAGREVDLVPHILEDQAGLVLKPAHGYGGRSVLIGDQVTPSEWESGVMAAEWEPWVVQERVPIPEEPFPVWDAGSLTFETLKVNANPFYVAGADVGAVTRASRESVINVSAGGGSVPTFVVG
jgi:hypothetical protein